MLNTKTRQSWHALTGHPSVMPQDWIIRNPSKDMVFFSGLVALKPDADGIATSRDGRKLFYAVMTRYLVRD